MRKGGSGRKRIALQMKKEVTDKRHGNTFNKSIEKLIEFLEDSRSSRKRKKKKDSWSTVQRITRRFVGFVDDVTPADCGLDFEGISSPQSPAITGRTITEVIMVSLADSTDDCTGILTGNDAS